MKLQKYNCTFHNFYSTIRTPVKHFKNVFSFRIRKKPSSFFKRSKFLFSQEKSCVDRYRGTSCKWFWLRGQLPECCLPLRTFRRYPTISPFGSPQVEYHAGSNLRSLHESTHYHLFFHHANFYRFLTDVKYAIYFERNRIIVAVAFFLAMNLIKWKMFNIQEYHKNE